MFGQEDYVSCETARVLHEKGYSGTVTAATLYEVQKWLREKHKIYVSSLPTKVDEETVWYYVITKDVLDDGIYGNVSNNSYNTYEEALSTGINEVLKFI